LDQREWTLQAQTGVQTKKLKEVCQLESNPLIQSLSAYLKIDISRFWHKLLRIFSMSLRVGGEATKKGVGCLYPKA
jgi:hypothetical protein